MKTLLLTAFISTCFGLCAQSYFEIKSLGSEYTASQVESAFNSANFCGFYLSTERRSLEFQDGTIVELLAASEIDELNENCVLAGGVSTETCVYSLNGTTIQRTCEYELSPAEKKRNQQYNN